MERSLWQCAITVPHNPGKGVGKATTMERRMDEDMRRCV